MLTAVSTADRTTLVVMLIWPTLPLVLKTELAGTAQAPPVSALPQPEATVRLKASAADVDTPLGGSTTVRVKLWAASGLTPLAALRVSRYVPVLAAAGVPARRAVP